MPYEAVVKAAPVTIMATRARTLAFVTNGKQVFAKSVFSPGLAMRPFLWPSLQENAATIREQLQQALDEELGKTVKES